MHLEGYCKICDGDLMSSGRFYNDVLVCSDCEQFDSCEEYDLCPCKHYKEQSSMNDIQRYDWDVRQVIEDNECDRTFCKL